MALPIRVNVVIFAKNGQPCIKLIRCSNESNLIKQVCSAAFNDKQITILPQFTDKLQSIASMTQKGIIYFNEDKNQYEFLI